MKLYIGADFSISKPAFSIETDDKLEFYVFPQCITDKEEDKLSSAHVHVFNRRLDPLDTKDIYGKYKRYTHLSNMIVSEIKRMISDNNIEISDVYFSSEGLSFGSKGNMVEELASAKAILMSRLIDLGITNIYTYSPVSIKSYAGCGKKGDHSKDAMINAFMMQVPKNDFMDIMIKDPQLMKNKTNYIHCVDDIVDSYWCLEKMKNSLI